MKRCPQCNTVFEDDKAYCTHDGSSLIVETFPLPSDFTPEDHDEGEQQTVIRNPQMHFDISNPKIPEPQPQVQYQPQAPAPVNQYAPNHGNTPPQVSNKPNRGCFKYTMILLVGLLIGGGIVLATMGIGFVFMNSPVNENETVNTEKDGEKTPTEKSNDDSDKKSTNNHSEKNADVNESSLNGQIIRNRATLRSSPSDKAKRIDRLPKNDRIEIIRRRSSTSKWYQIECEHGSKGWIDGYLIEFTQ